jgi:hypothetical protein
MTVFVDVKDAARARKLLGTTVRKSASSVGILQLAVALCLGALMLGIVAIVAAVAR